MANYTDKQKEVIETRGSNLLVSASAGSGKTTVMIERLFRLIKNGEIDLSNVVVVTFTNLAAAEMKKRLSDKLSAEKNNPAVAEQLEKIDGCSISTLHSFCCDVLRNYFYLVDIDPNFAILDDTTVGKLRSDSLAEVFKTYYDSDDEVFEMLYGIFSKKRNEEAFKAQLLKLYEFARCQADFYGWYGKSRNNMLCFGQDNVILTAILKDIRKNFDAFRQMWLNLADGFAQAGAQECCTVCQGNADGFAIGNADLEKALLFTQEAQITSLPRKNAKREAGLDAETMESLRERFKSVKADCDDFLNAYRQLTDGKDYQTLLDETRDTVKFTDKLTEILFKFEEVYTAAKKEKGGVDFGDLEHLTLRVFGDEEARAQLREKYKLVFVDEYQDTNDVQEALICCLQNTCNMFMVGDVKQSIYGFRGCDPTIFLGKYRDYGLDGKENKVIELNDNFRSDKQVLNFVNTVMDYAMTEDFGKVDYAGTSRLKGAKSQQSKFPSVQIDVIEGEKREKPFAKGLYDVTVQTNDVKTFSRSEGEVVALRIMQLVGSNIVCSDGNVKRMGYGDIVILSRGMKDKALDVYNVLAEHNIPVVADFKTENHKNKEVKDLLNLLRVIDNPLCDVPMTGVCLSHFGGLTEQQLADVKTATADYKFSLYERLQYYQSSHNDETADKITRMIDGINHYRFYGEGATVDALVLEIFAQSNYTLRVSGLPNGNLRLQRLYAFADSLRGKYYSQSVDKFIQYLDESAGDVADEGISRINAVRIMTMHASKGLEFPVVFVIGTNGKFVNDYPVVECNAESGLAMKYYDFEAMKVYKSLASVGVGLFNAQKSREEELRLLYVALTRAENHLFVVCSDCLRYVKNASGRPPQNAQSHAEWILSAMKHKYGDAFVDGFDGDGVCLTVWNRDEVNAVEAQAEADGLLCKQYTDWNAQLTKMNYVYSFASEKEIPTKVVSSALDKMYLDLTEEPPSAVIADDFNKRGDDTNRKLGIYYHKVYETVDYDADLPAIKSHIQSLADAGKIESEYAPLLDADLIYATLHNQQLRKLMNGNVYHELPFMLNCEFDEIVGGKRGKTILQGVIDLLVINQDKATVVDFKYTYASDNLEERYAKQLSSYGYAVRNITDIQNVECYVLSIADNKLVKIY
ncbi:MAG: UvrD-helicase domain-containing protein [Corallococcus sp.]|nr:UvrD-helicase domain-containing protein [Corallococcus sp.]